ncbi:MAG: transposase, partial [Desulfobulbaceae bacterium]|nr:transposase [Desulfobulbaceae bacterium]
LEIIPDWQELLSTGLLEDDYKTIRRHERSGRPLGGESFIDHLEQLTSRLLRKKKPGPKKDN